jgi:hypothetical protein
MIKYNLTCKCSFAFDSWFASSEEFERLMKRKIVTCIECNSNDVNKSIMAPNVSYSKKNNNNNYKFQKNIKKKIIEYQKFIEKNCRYVGDNFAQEVRSIYYDDKKETKGIYGRVSAEEIEELHEEGIETTAIPWYDKTEN